MVIWFRKRAYNYAEKLLFFHFRILYTIPHRDLLDVMKEVAMERLRNTALIALSFVGCAALSSDGGGGGGGAVAEPDYAFRERMADLHPNRLASDAAPPAADETVVDGSWRLVCESDDPVLLHGVCGLRSAGLFRPLDGSFAQAG